MFLSSPTKAFIKEDFPTFGLPTIANLGRSDSSLMGSGGNIYTTSSNNSPVPEPLIEDIQWYSPKPKE